MDHSHSESHHHVNYFLVFVALCICTAISVVFDVIELSPLFVVVAVLAVAVAKASFVMTYFMHLKFEGRWKYIILMPTAILAVGLMIALAPDMAMHYYENDAMQSRIMAHDASHDDGHGEQDEAHHEAEHDDHSH